MKKKCKENPTRKKGINRRDVLKWCAALGGVAGLPLGLNLPFGLKKAEAKEPYGSKEQVVYSGCTVNCGSQCTLRIFSKNGIISRVESDNSEDNDHNRAIRACLRGRSMRKYTYSPDRIKYPMRRIPGTKRGEGKFERISWETAYETVAKEWARILKTYGPESIYRKYGSGSTSSGLVNRNEWVRLANLAGGFLNEYGNYSAAQIGAAMPYLYGSDEGNTINDMEHSKLIVMFGLNILETRASGGGLSYELFEAKKRGNARIIIIDPRYSDSVAKLADQWVPIRPGSDAALVAGIAHVLITENLADMDFLNTYCIGFDEAHMPEGIAEGNSYKSYILGKGADKTVKTPEWAAKITGYPAEKIIQLAREIGSAKPCCIIQSWGVQRHACGDTSCRAIATLAIMTGNVGIHGGGSGSTEGISQISFPKLPTGKNPVRTAISFYTWEKAITDPKEITSTKAALYGKNALEHGIKFIWNSSGNSLINQHSDINGTRKTLEDDSLCEFIVVCDTRLTSSAMFADILLPATTPPEHDDVIQEGYQVDQSSLLIARKAIEPIFECKSNYDICNELSAYLGKYLGQDDLQQKYSRGRSQLDWAKWIYAESRKIKPDLPESFEEASEIGLFTWFPMPQKVAYKEFREDPIANPLYTPSGKIEIFSKQLWELNETWEFPEGDSIHAIPVFESTWEGPDDIKGKEKYPFQLIGHHFKGRVHSSYGNIPWLTQVAPQQIWINTLDAQARGINHGDTVRVYNGRGMVQVKAKVTPRIMPGVLSLPQGAWYKPNKKGIDEGGCINTLTKTHPTPLAKGNPQHTNLVAIEKI